LIELDPKDIGTVADSYFERAMARLDKGDVGDAVADCDKSLAVHKPEEDGATEIYEVRAIARQLAHDTPGALADLREGTNLHDPYCALWLFLRQAESGQRDDGAKVLSAELDQEAAIEAKQPCLSPGPEWLSRVGSMLLGKATVAELLAVAGTER
jgi:hypothetical protein